MMTPILPGDPLWRLLYEQPRDQEPPGIVTVVCFLLFIIFIVWLYTL